MKTYETSATVQDRGQVHLAAVPFAPGTQVEVRISAKEGSPGEAASPADGAIGAALRWEGNVLVHEGVGAAVAPSVAELREERLDRLGGGPAK